MAASQSVWEANSYIVNGYIWISILDERTSNICQSLSRRVFQVGKGPLPPAHQNCRSTTVPTLITKYVNGELVEAEDVEKPSYYEWIKRQDEEFQDLALGPTRAKLLRDGGLSATEFAKLSLSKSFEPLTLDEMKKVNPVAFRRAGLVEWFTSSNILHFD